MVRLNTRCLRGSVSRRRIETPNKAHIALQGMPTTVPTAATSSAPASGLCPAGMNTDATVMALTQLLGFSAWNVAAWANDTAFGACAPPTAAPLSFQARYTRYSEPATRNTCCASG
ncbi:hypothetical protein D9M69_688560 [compost metagenome]